MKNSSPSRSGSTLIALLALVLTIINFTFNLLIGLYVRSNIEDQRKNVANEKALTDSLNRLSAVLERQ